MLICFFDFVNFFIPGDRCKWQVQVENIKNMAEIMIPVV